MRQILYININKNSFKNEKKNFIFYMQSND